jgi:hypothetical protein
MQYNTAKQFSLVDNIILTDDDKTVDLNEIFKHAKCLVYRKDSQDAEYIHVFNMYNEYFELNFDDGKAIYLKRDQLIDYFLNHNVEMMLDNDCINLMTLKQVENKYRNQKKDKVFSRKKR